jgi:hypothetical protein
MPVTNRKVRVGVCAMDKKAKSKAMNAILTRLEKFGEFEILVFGDDCILNKPIEEWPKVDALLSWFSDGFPLKKAQAYARLNKPFVVNDLSKQWDLLDRRVVYRTLQDNNIPVPPHIVVNRNTPAPRGVMPTHEVEHKAEGFEEYEDYVECDGVRINKPFVEKPADAENHNICIYYPHTVGGGYKALFRKVGNQASKYYPPPAADSDKPYTLVRRDTSFIYEDFMSTGGTDVKVYTVGPNYAHAEARKSPVVDGRVQRDANGKEERFPVLLTPEEKEIARRVSLAFGQMVCGFDLLRTKGRSYVCDVNGWSFVKTSTKYFDDASLCLRAMILKAVAPEHRRTAEAAREAEETAAEDKDDTAQDDEEKAQRAAAAKAKKKGEAEELRAVLAVIRHGDRTPKQKMKMRVRHKPLLDLLDRCTSSRPRKQAKLKTPQRLQELLNICRVLYSDSLKEGQKFASSPLAGTVENEFPIGASTPSQSREEWEEELEQWKQVVSILQEGGHFSGINRKAQLKPLAWDPIPEEERGEPKDGKDPASERVTEALLILKFGGVLTHLGKNQAEFLGRDFRMRMYPGGNYYDPAAADGLLRLHSTYRHDLKIYSSDEGRVQITAAAFAKGLLDLETDNNQLTPILASLVNKDAKLLDFVTHEVEEDILHAKQKLYNIMTEGHVKGRTKNKEYSTSDTAVIDDDFERAGPVGYLRRNSINRASPMRMPDPKAGEGSASSPKAGKLSTSAPDDEGKNSYAMMAADRKRALKTARRSIALAAASAMSSFKNAMITAVAAGLTDDGPKKRHAPKPHRRVGSVGELNKLGERNDGGEDPGGSGTGSGGAPSVSGSVTDSAYGGGEDRRKSDDRRRSVEGMIGQMDLNDPDFSQLGQESTSSGPRASIDEDQEYRLSLERPSESNEFLARSSWNAGLAKDLLKSRLSLGLPEDGQASHRLSRGDSSNPDGGQRTSRRTSLDVGAVGQEEVLASVEGSITRRPPGVPPEPLKLLRLMVDLISGLTRQLREEVFRHSNAHHQVGSPTTWVDTLGALAPRGSMPAGGLALLKDTLVPAGGESFLLMHARWKKLEQDIYHPRKGRFDISKVPDVYDAAKYDAIHNSHLSLDGLEELYRVSRCLAEGVVPNEYGTHPQSKLRIGGTIAHSLLLKLLQDMHTTREESFVGMPQSHMERSTYGDSESDSAATKADGGGSSGVGGVDAGRTMSMSGDDSAPMSGVDEEDAAALKEEEETELSTTRLNHRYANALGVNSPHRHVRTRLYFTSESHIHSLLNVLRYCNLEVAQLRSGSELDIAGASGLPPSLLSRSIETLDNIGDLDYLTHIVFRMYECFEVPTSDPRRFRVEILLSTGVGLDPFKHNVIQEFDKAAEEAHRKERASASPQIRKRRSEDGVLHNLPILRQFPIQNERAHACGAFSKSGTESESSPGAAGKVDEKLYLTLNDLETYLWKFRRNRSGTMVTGGGSGAQSDAWSSPKKSGMDVATPVTAVKSGLGGPKKPKPKKKKGSDSESD